MAEPAMEEAIDIATELLPCTICGRTFLPVSLHKHSRVCERNATKKRKIFDSLKQRVKGTDLALFHQKRYLRRQDSVGAPNHHVEAKQCNNWKQKHIELVNAIRAAKGVPSSEMSPVQKKSSMSVLNVGNERCPSCERQFGPKAYDRHVEWCKEKKARIQQSPASVLQAKERLDARIKYRVPPLNKPKKLTTKEKYSPGTTTVASSPNNLFVNKSAANFFFERSPSVRKPKSTVNIAVGHSKEAKQRDNKGEAKKELMERSAQKEKKMPEEHLKNSQSRPKLPKINTVDINKCVGEMTVTKLTNDGLPPLKNIVKPVADDDQGKALKNSKQNALKNDESKIAVREEVGRRSQEPKQILTNKAGKCVEKVSKAGKVNVIKLNDGFLSNSCAARSNGLKNGLKPENGENERKLPEPQQYFADDMMRLRRKIMGTAKCEPAKKTPAAEEKEKIVINFKCNMEKYKNKAGKQKPKAKITFNNKVEGYKCNAPLTEHSSEMSTTFEKDSLESDSQEEQIKLSPKNYANSNSALINESKQLISNTSFGNSSLEFGYCSSESSTSLANNAKTTIKEPEVVTDAEELFCTKSNSDVYELESLDGLEVNKHNDALSTARSQVYANIRRCHSDLCLKKKSDANLVTSTETDLTKFHVNYDLDDEQEQEQEPDPEPILQGAGAGDFFGNPEDKDKEKEPLMWSDDVPRKKRRLNDDSEERIYIRSDLSHEGLMSDELAAKQLACECCTRDFAGSNIIPLGVMINLLGICEKSAGSYLPVIPEASNECSSIHESNTNTNTNTDTKTKKTSCKHHKDSSGRHRTTEHCCQSDSSSNSSHCEHTLSNNSSSKTKVLYSKAKRYPSKQKPQTYQGLYHQTKAKKSKSKRKPKPAKQPQSSNESITNTLQSHSKTLFESLHKLTKPNGTSKHQQSDMFMLPSESQSTKPDEQSINESEIEILSVSLNVSETDESEPETPEVKTKKRSEDYLKTPSAISTQCCPEDSSKDSDVAEIHLHTSYCLQQCDGPKCTRKSNVDERYSNKQKKAPRRNNSQKHHNEQKIAHSSASCGNENVETVNNAKEETRKKSSARSKSNASYGKETLKETTKERVKEHVKEASKKNSPRSKFNPCHGNETLEKTICSPKGHVEETKNKTSLRSKCNACYDKDALEGTAKALLKENSRKSSARSKTNACYGTDHETLEKMICSPKGKLEKNKTESNARSKCNACYGDETLDETSDSSKENLKDACCGTETLEEFKESRKKPNAQSKSKENSNNAPGVNEILEETTSTATGHSEKHKMNSNAQKKFKESSNEISCGDETLEETNCSTKKNCERTCTCSKPKGTSKNAFCGNDSFEDAHLGAEKHVEESRKKSSTRDKYKDNFTDAFCGNGSLKEANFSAEEHLEAIRKKSSTRDKYKDNFTNAFRGNGSIDDANLDAQENLQETLTKSSSRVKHKENLADAFCGSESFEETNCSTKRNCERTCTCGKPKGAFKDTSCGNESLEEAIFSVEEHLEEIRKKSSTRDKYKDNFTDAVHSNENVEEANFGVEEHLEEIRKKSSTRGKYKDNFTDAFRGNGSLEEANFGAKKNLEETMTKSSTRGKHKDAEGNFQEHGEKTHSLSKSKENTKDVCCGNESLEEASSAKYKIEEITNEINIGNDPKENSKDVCCGNESLEEASKHFKKAKKEAGAHNKCRENLNDACDCKIILEGTSKTVKETLRGKNGKLPYHTEFLKGRCSKGKHCPKLLVTKFEETLEVSNQNPQNGYFCKGVTKKSGAEWEPSNHINKDAITPRTLDLLHIAFKNRKQGANKEEMVNVTKTQILNLLKMNYRNAEKQFNADLRPQENFSDKTVTSLKLPEIRLKSSNQCASQNVPKNFNVTLPTVSTNCHNRKLKVFGDESTDMNGEPPPHSMQSLTGLGYNPFISAERQLMELLECDDFKPFNNTKRPQTTDNTSLRPKSPLVSKSNKKFATKTKSADKSHNNKINLTKITQKGKRASVIDPPQDFQDKHINDSFEMLENFINKTFGDGSNLMDDIDDFDKIFKDNKSKHEKNNVFFLSDKDNYSLSAILSDDHNPIDPRLINENDNLTIPDDFKSNHSSPDSDVHEVDHYSEQYDKKISALEAETDNLKSDELDDLISSLNFSNKPNTKYHPKSAAKSKKVNSLSSSIVGNNASSNNNSANGDKKKNLSSLKRSISLLDPVLKPRSLKSKKDVENYFEEQELRTVKKEPIKKQQSVVDDLLTSPPKAEELFSVDDEMYEEYKKYEQMYLKEKEEKLRKTLNETPSEDDDSQTQQVNKLSGDSAYGSLNRKSPKIRSRAHKLSPLGINKNKQTTCLESPSSSGSESSPQLSSGAQNANQKMSKFCHECGNKYPVNSAKFCVECGVKRLLL